MTTIAHRQPMTDEEQDVDVVVPKKEVKTLKTFFGLQSSTLHTRESQFTRKSPVKDLS